MAHSRHLFAVGIGFVAMVTVAFGCRNFELPPKIVHGNELIGIVGLPTLWTFTEQYGGSTHETVISVGNIQAKRLSAPAEDQLAFAMVSVPDGTPSTQRYAINTERGFRVRQQAGK
jgi:hypothetical protein